MRSVSVKARIAKTRTIRACAKAGWGQCFFFPSAGRVTLLHETGCLHIKGINIFGYEIVIETESEKISKFSTKIVGNRRKLSLGAPVNYRLTLPLLSLPTQFFFSFTLGHYHLSVRF